MPKTANSNLAGLPTSKVPFVSDLGAILPGAGVYLLEITESGWKDSAGLLDDRVEKVGPASLRSVIKQVTFDTRPNLLTAIHEAQRRGHSACEIKTHREGRAQWFRVHLSVRKSKAASPWQIVLIDVSGEHERIERHRAEEEHLRNIVEYNPQLPWIADASGRVIDFTDRWLQSTGLSREEALGEGWVSGCHADDVERVASTIASVCETGESFDVIARLRVDDDYRWMRARGYPKKDETGQIVCWYGYTEDVHEKVLIDQQIRWDAEHDGLTGLYNRTYFSTALASAIATAPARIRKVGLLLIDLDNFKDVNDVLGHSAGDELLRQFGEFLASAAPKGSVVARLGGDEFAVLLDSADDLSEVVRVGEELLSSELMLEYDNRSTPYSISLGVGLYPDHGFNSTQLMKNTDLALYRAKSNGRSQVQIFENELLDKMHERLAMVNRARTAAKDNRILAYYQPKICLETGELAGFEALLRWQDDKGNIHAPDKIYAAFEEKVVADMLGKAMINHVLNDMTYWKAGGLDVRQVAINASPAEMRQTTFVNNLIESLDNSGVSYGEIEIEITEGVLLGAGADASRKAIERMSALGIPLALDDFGTGYASLSHLRSLPISTIKVDRSFVSEIGNNPTDKAIVAAIISMGKAVGMRVVAEGIETEAQQDILKDLGCDVGQGFFFGRPVPSREVPSLVRGWNGTFYRNANRMKPIEELAGLPRRMISNAV